MQNNIIGKKKKLRLKKCVTKIIILQSKLHLSSNVLFPYNSQQEY